jgi:hypothetical protein
VVSIDDQVAVLTDLSMMEFNATTTALGADLPGKEANPWISRHRVSSNSMTTTLPEPRRAAMHGHPKRDPHPPPALKSIFDLGRDLIGNRIRNLARFRW